LEVICALHLLTDFFFQRSDLKFCYGPASPPVNETGLPSDLSAAQLLTGNQIQKQPLTFSVPGESEPDILDPDSVERPRGSASSLAISAGAVVLVFMFHLLGLLLD
jgi:hypothetical protein